MSKIWMMSLSPNHFINLIFFHFKLFTTRCSTKKCPSLLLVWIPFFSVVTKRETHTAFLVNIALVRNCEISSTSKDRTEVRKALNRFLLSFQVHLLEEVNWQQKAHSSIIRSKSLRWIPRNRGISSDNFSKLCFD